MKHRITSLATSIMVALAMALQFTSCTTDDEDSYYFDVPPRFVGMWAEDPTFSSYDNYVIVIEPTGSYGFLIYDGTYLQSEYYSTLMISEDDWMRVDFMGSTYQGEIYLDSADTMVINSMGRLPFDSYYYYVPSLPI